MDLDERKEGEKMINFHKAKTKKIISAIVVIILVIAMLLPSIASIFTM